MNSPFARIALITIFGGCLAAVGSANFVDGGYNGGSQLVAGGVGTPTGGSLDDGYFNVVLGGAASFYGATQASIQISTNGNLNFNNDTTFSNAGLDSASTVQRLALFWDDWDLRTTAAGTGELWAHDTADLFSATYINVSAYAGGPPSAALWSAQAVIFKNNLNLNGFSFLAGDIAYSYNAIGTVNTNGTVGVRQSATAWTAAPASLGGTANGLFDTTAAANLPTDSRFILFRWNAASGAYDASLQPVPEPASLAILGMGALALLRRRKKA